MSAGGVPRLVDLLGSSSGPVAGAALTALSRLNDHALAMDAIR